MTEAFLDYAPQGEVRRLWHWLQEKERPPFEVVVDGPQGTGKSRAIGEFLWLYARTNPGCRILVLRKTRVSLTTSWLVTFENLVLTDAERLRFLKPARANRHSYVFSNGAEIVLGGMDNADRILSTEYDVIYCNEVTEFTEDEWEKLGNRLRYKHGPFHLLLGDCNPGPPTHWVYRRWQKDRTARIHTRHEDNPSLEPAYLERLSRQTGVRRKRLYEGLWVAAEGMVWETFDPEVNVITAPKKPDGTVDYAALGIRSFFASQDWGFTAPGSLSVYGVDGDARLYRVAQYYRTGQLVDWWADRVAELYREFKLRVVLCDPADPDAIERSRIRLARDKATPGMVIAADNTKASSGKGDLTGLDLPREGFRVAGDGRPRIVFLRDSLRGRDPELDAAGAPCSTEEEIPGYVFDRTPDGEILERTDDTCPDHGCDELRYACTWAWRTTTREKLVEPVYQRGSWGEAMAAAGIKLPRPG